MAAEPRARQAVVKAAQGPSSFRGAGQLILPEDYLCRDGSSPFDGARCKARRLEQWRPAHMSLIF
jgi:hypothetical protein